MVYVLCLCSNSIKRYSCESEPRGCKRDVVARAGSETKTRGASVFSEVVLVEGLAEGSRGRLTR
jgi:hypothetical protein